MPLSEHRENGRHHVGGQSDPGIADAHVAVTAVGARLQPDRAARLGVLARVVQHVVDDLQQPRGIAVDLLFDLESDPDELHDLAGDPAHAAVLAELKAEARARWDLARFDADVRASQARRWVVYEALRNGAYFPWDFQPLQRASEQYMRNHMDLNVLESAKRFPRGE